MTNTVSLKFHIQLFCLIDRTNSTKIRNEHVFRIGFLPPQRITLIVLTTPLYVHVISHYLTLWLRNCCLLIVLLHNINYCFFKTWLLYYKHMVLFISTRVIYYRLLIVIKVTFLKIRTRNDGELYESIT